MAEMTVAEIDAEIAELEAALSTWLKGEHVSEVGYDGTNVRFGGDLLARPAMIRQQIASLKDQRARLLGQKSPNGPMNFGFGGRL